MGYTITNLRNVKDSAPAFKMQDTQEARFATGELDADQTGVAYLVVRPGQRIPFGHRHDKAEEVYVVISGSGRFRLDDEWVEVSRLDAIRLSPSVTRGVEAGPGGLEYIAFGPHHEGDAEMIPGFWDEAGNESSLSAEELEDAEGAQPPASPPF